MTSPTARVLALLEILQSGGGLRTVPDLAASLDVDERTVRRYLGHLLDLGVPVESVRGRYGGYRLAPGYRMPPLMLTDDEALAVLLGLLAGRRAGLVTTSVAAGESATAKLRRVLPRRLGQRLDALLETTGFTGAPGPRPPSADAGPSAGRGAGSGTGAGAGTGTDRGAGAGGAPSTPEAEVLLELAEAARLRRPVALTYRDRKGRVSERTALPYGLVAHAGRWYLTAAGAPGEEVRTFRLDRITALSVQPGSFAVPADFDPVAAVLDSLARTPWAHEVSLRVQADAAHIRRHLPPDLATLSPLPDAATGHDENAPAHEAAARAGVRDEWIRVRMRAERLEWIPAVLAALDRPFVIEQPPALGSLVRALARRLAEHAR
ncbi:helix-turn-helix transcriptional regulator [Streptomyces axinellae]|uniref:WYL domain-containing protein n=1 Tax=Streptomyces axinellae TaxID=552788 RepID=A0ABN3QKB7_9ACTN